CSLKTVDLLPSICSLKTIDLLPSMYYNRPTAVHVFVTCLTICKVFVQMLLKDNRPTAVHTIDLLPSMY
ncbi:hypothetical protein L9F63_019434, partial [Diploptera punctata]